MNGIWKSTKMAINLAGAHYPDGAKKRRFNSVVEAPGAEQVKQFGEAIATLGKDDIALGAEITTMTLVNF